MRRITITMLITLLVPIAMMGADAKFFRKAADRVWSMRPDLFDLAGDVKRIEGKQRERMTDISYKAANQENYTLTLNIPDGYEVDDASLQVLAKNVQTPVGMFVTGAKKAEDGKSVTIGVRSRINRPLLSIAAWPHILELTDAKADFGDAVVILKKK